MALKIYNLSNPAEDAAEEGERLTLMLTPRALPPLSALRLPALGEALHFAPAPVADPEPVHDPEPRTEPEPVCEPEPVPSVSERRRKVEWVERGFEAGWMALLLACAAEGVYRLLWAVQP